MELPSFEELVRSERSRMQQERSEQAAREASRQQELFAQREAARIRDLEERPVIAAARQDLDQVYDMALDFFPDCVLRIYSHTDQNLTRSKTYYRYLKG